MIKIRKENNEVLYSEEEYISINQENIEWLKDLSLKRPAHGISPIYIKKIIGKKAKKNFRKDELIKI